MRPTRHERALQAWGQRVFSRYPWPTFGFWQPKDAYRDCWYPLSIRFTEPVIPAVLTEGAPAGQRFVYVGQAATIWFNPGTTVWAYGAGGARETLTVESASYQWGSVTFTTPLTLNHATGSLIKAGAAGIWQAGAVPKSGDPPNLLAIMQTLAGAVNAERAGGQPWLPLATVNQDEGRIEFTDAGGAFQVLVEGVAYDEGQPFYLNAATPVSRYWQPPNTLPNVEPDAVLVQHYGQRVPAFIFANQEGPRPVLPYGTILVTSRTDLGVPEHDLFPEQAGLDAEGGRLWKEKTWAHKRGTCSVQVFGEGATELMELLVRSVSLEAERAALQADGVVIQSIQQAVDSSGLSGKLWEARARADLTFGWMELLEDGLAAVETVVASPRP